jgi:hypothetical protein
MSLMHATGYLQATKSQDKIFGLYGLCNKRDRFVKPDYSRPAVEIYMELVESFIERDHNLHCLLGNRQFELGHSP